MESKLLQVQWIFFLLGILVILVGRNSTWYGARRAAVLLVPVVSWVFIFVPAESALIAIDLPVLDVLAQTSSVGEPAFQEGFSWLNAFWWITSGFVSFRVLRLVYFYVKVYRLKRRSSLGLEGVYESPLDQSFTVFGIVFIQKGLSPSDRKMVVAHEQMHVRLGHPLDRIFWELVLGLNWFNPVVYYLKRELEDIHEFQVDGRMSQEFDDRSYVDLMTAIALGHSFGMSQNFGFNKSQIIKRVSMLNKKQKRSWEVARLCLLGVLAFGTLSVSWIAPTMQEKSEQSEEDVIVQPVFKGGTDGLMSYLVGKISYPKEDKEARVEGMVVVSFTVGTDGAVSEAKVIKSLSEATDKEALRVVTSMPAWTPGTKNGEVQAMVMNLPIRFALGE